MEGMTRNEYLAQLRALLTGRMPPEELERILAYYTEYFDEAGPQGEAKVMEELGTPGELVGRILGRRPAPPAERDRTPEDARPGRGLSALWKVLLAICAAPIAIPLIVGAAALILAVLAAVVALVAGVVVGGVIAVGAGIFAFCAGFGALFSAGLPTAMFCCGMGMLTSGGGLLLITGALLLAGLCCRAVAGGMGRWLRRKEGRV